MLLGGWGFGEFKKSVRALCCIVLISNKSRGVNRTVLKVRSNISRDVTASFVLF
jgi:hypothetical protein